MVQLKGEIEYGSFLEEKRLKNVDFTDFLTEIHSKNCLNFNFL